MEHPLRRRQVRFEYPTAAKQLVCALAPRFGRRRIARALRIPLSTIYRWLAAERVSGSQTTEQESAELLTTRCESLGFAFRDALRGIGVPLSEKVSAPTAMFSPVFAIPMLSHESDRLLKARDFVEQHYYRQISCERLAADIGMSKFHFIKEFGDRFGAPPHRYLLQVRIAQASRLLRLASPSLEAIAAATGFNTTSSFVKAFRSIRGESVAAYLRRGGAAPRSADQSAANA